MRQRRKLILAAAAIAWLPSLDPLWAGSTWTFNNSGDWSTASNWLGGVPGNGADAHIVHSDLFSRTITYDYTGSAVTLGTLEVSNGGISRIPTVDTLSQSAHTLTANYEYIGTNGDGVYNQSGGTNTFNSSLQLGELASSNGTYSLSAGILNSAAGSMDVGSAGAGTFNQSGGTVTLTSSGAALILGDGTTATGTYLLSGNGVLNVSSGPEYIGNNGNGTFLQTGGTHNVQYYMFVGNASGSSGTYNLGNGTISSNAVLNAGTEEIGSLGFGNFIQTGGTNTVFEINVGDAGVFLGGTYTLGNSTASSSAVVNSTTENIGHFGNGTFIQTGGTHTIGGSLILGDFLGTNGTYSLSGGILNVGYDEFIGNEGAGTFIQSGGTHTLGSATLPANMYLGWASYSSVAGYYALSGTGQAIVHGNLYMMGTDLAPGDHTFASLMIGGSGTASGGSMTITGLLKIWDSSVSTISFSGVNLGTGGFLSVGSIDYSSKPSLFQWSAGTLQTTFGLDVSTLGILGSSITLPAGKTLIPAGGLNIQPDGVLNLTSGAMIIPSASTATNRGVFNQTGGSLTINGEFLNSATASFGGMQSWGPASVFVSLAGVSTFNSALGPTGPVVVITGGSVNFNAPMLLQSLTLNDAPASFSGGGVSTVKSLAIYGSGKLDLANSNMIIDYTGPVGALVDGVRQYLQAGQLTSSAADAAHRLGYADNALLGLATFGGQAVDSSSLLIKYTYGGDANLDGKVDIADLKMLASHWNQSTAVWTGGDFNYDGVVNVADLYLLAKDWQDGVGSPLASPLSLALASLGLPEIEVPEPLTLICLPALLAWSLKRPRRRHAAR